MQQVMVEIMTAAKQADAKVVEPLLETFRVTTGRILQEVTGRSAF